MKESSQSNRFKGILFLLLIMLFTANCKRGVKIGKTNVNEEIRENFIEIVTESMDIQLIDTISSGWNTFRYHNNSKDTHLILFDKYPEGKTIEDAEKYVVPVFQKGMDFITAGNSEEGFAEFNNLPEWFFSVIYSGGIGLISPNKTAETTLKLEPGYYIVECYVKMENGMFHTSMGMSTSLIVSDEVSENKELVPTVSVSISGEEGIVFNDTIKMGKHVFSVYFKDQKSHENFLGHDVNLVKVEEGVNVKTLVNWINWAEPTGLISPAPDGFTFLGGVNDMPAGGTGYFTAMLEEGNYVLISEVPNADSKNMLKYFTISN
mgnify:FL=1